MTWLAPLLLAICAIGCQPPPKPLPPISYESIKSIDYVVAAVNANNEKLPMLWAAHDYEATFFDDQKRSHFINGDGVLLYRSPSDLRLQGSKDLIGPVFDLGTNSENYWVSIIPQVDTIWYGNYSDLTDAALNRDQIPIQPDMILQVLGIGPIDDKLNDLPAPTMRFNDEMRAYMLVWNVKMPDRWLAQREVWYDFDTLRPIRVFLFDARGRVVVRGILTDHRQVEVPNTPRATWPWVPGKYSLFFPVNGSRMQFTLKDVMLAKGQGARRVPNDRSFRRPAIGASHEIQIR